jgi:hypothetical protein
VARGERERLLMVLQFGRQRLAGIPYDAC